MENWKVIFTDSRWLKFILALFWSFVASAFIFTVVLADIPKENQAHVNTILGFVLGTIVATIINYFFGSSQSSSDKNELINNQGKKELQDNGNGKV